MGKSASKADAASTARAAGVQARVQLRPKRQPTLADVVKRHSLHVFSLCGFQTNHRTILESLTRTCLIPLMPKQSKERIYRVKFCKFGNLDLSEKSKDHM